MKKDYFYSKRKTPLVTIVVLMHNHAKVTLECLKTISRYTKEFPFEVIVVDNDSSAKQSEILQNGLVQFSKPLPRFVKLRQNIGFAAANNLAANKANGKILVFLNNDVIVTSGWLKPLVSFLQKSPKFAACQPKLRSFVQKEYFDYAGGSGGFLDMFGYPFTRGRVFDSMEKDVGQYNTIKEVLWASGSCLVVKNEAFRKMAGFDEHFFAYGEEIDLCLRLRQAGYKIFCIPKSIVYHYGALTSNKNLSRKIFLVHYNNLYLIFKHYSIWPYLPLIICRILFDGGAILYYLWEAKFNFILSVFRAYWEILQKIPEFISKGVITWKGRSLLSCSTIYRRSIVVDYFLLRRRTFSQLMTGKSEKGAPYKRYVDITYFGKRGREGFSD